MRCLLLGVLGLGAATAGAARAQTVYASWSDNLPGSGSPPWPGYTVTLELLDNLPAVTRDGYTYRRAPVGSVLHFQVRLTNESGAAIPAATTWAHVASFQGVWKASEVGNGVSSITSLPNVTFPNLVSAKLAAVPAGGTTTFRVNGRCRFRGRDVVRATWVSIAGASRYPSAAAWIDCYRPVMAVLPQWMDPNQAPSRPDKPSSWFGPPTVGDRDGRYLDVKRCGAKGDGKTDDTDAIQRCIDRGHELYLQGGQLTQSRIFFPPGRYYVSKRFPVPDSISTDPKKVPQSGALYLRSGVELYGVQSMKSVVTFRTNPERVVAPITDVPHEPHFVDCQGQACTYLFVAGWPTPNSPWHLYPGAGPGVGLSLHDLVLEGDETFQWRHWSTGTNHAAVSAYQVDNFDFQHLEVRGWYRGLALTSVANMVVRDSTFINNKYQAIGLWSSGALANAYLMFATRPVIEHASVLNPEKLPLARGLIQHNDFSNQKPFIENLGKVAQTANLMGATYTLILLGVYLSGSYQEMSHNAFHYATPFSLKVPSEVTVADNTSEYSLYFARVGHTEGGIVGRVVVERNHIRKSEIGIEVETCAHVADNTALLETCLAHAPLDEVIVRDNVLGEFIPNHGPGSDPWVATTHTSKHATFTNAAIRLSEAAGVTVQGNRISGLIQDFHVAGIHVGNSWLNTDPNDCWLARAPSRHIRVLDNQVAAWGGNVKFGVPLYVENTVDSEFALGSGTMAGQSRFFAATPNVSGLNVDAGSSAYCFGGPTEHSPAGCQRRLDALHPLSPFLAYQLCHTQMSSLTPVWNVVALEE